MESKNKYLIKNTIIFTIGTVGSKIISFFLIPLYTDILTTSQYGVIDLITTISSVAVPILTLNICESVMRFGLDKDSNCEKNIQIGTFILFLGAILGLLIIPPVCGMFQQIFEYSMLVYFYVLALATSQIYLCDLRGKELLLAYSIGCILQTFFIAVSNIIFLLGLKLEIKGYLMAYIFTNIIVSIYAIVVGKSYKSFKFNKIDFNKLREMLKYSAALIPNSFMWWIMNSSDRVMITSMLGFSVNGIYAISYKIPTMMSVFTAIFNQAWGYSVIKENGNLDEYEYTNKIFKFLISFTMLLGIALLVLSKPFLKIYVSKKYYEAWKYVPLLIIGSIYMTFGSFLASSYSVYKDSVGFLLSGFFGAVFNIVLNFIFIPVIGVYGAAFATCISYIIVFAFRLIHTRKYLKYDVCNKEFIIGTSLLIIITFFMYVDNFLGYIMQIVILFIAFIVYSKTLVSVIDIMIRILKQKR